MQGKGVKCPFFIVRMQALAPAAEYVREIVLVSETHQAPEFV
jgi:hypothetical protein